MSDKAQPVWTPETQKQNLRWNYLALAIDGAAFMGGIYFVSNESVMPNLVRSLGGADWIVALAPSLMLLGFVWTPFFSAHHVERLRLYRPFSLFWGTFQRLPPLFAALALLYGWDHWPTASFWVVVLSPMLTGLFGGFGTPAFWELYGKVLPANKCSGNVAIRNSGGLLIGILAGVIISHVLGDGQGRKGYAVLFLLQFACYAVSYAAFLTVRELPNPPAPPRPHHGLLENLRAIPDLFRTEHNFRRYLGMRLLGQGYILFLPFLALGLRQKLGLTEEFLGTLVQAQMIGGLGGAVFAGVMGDRIGSRIPLLTGRFLSVLVAIGALFVRDTTMAFAVFFFLGLFLNINLVSENTLLLEIAAPARRPTLQAIVAMMLVPTIFVLSWVSKWLHSMSEGLLWPSLGGATLLLLSFFMLRRITAENDPLHGSTSTEPKPKP